jgi:hypothetical protein
MTRRQLETGETWQLVRANLNERIAGLSNAWLDEKNDAECHRIQGAIKELMALRDDWPATFPDEVVDGKPTKDPVLEAIDGQRH